MHRHCQSTHMFSVPSTLFSETFCDYLNDSVPATEKKELERKFNPKGS
ncbi:hypothetical protein SAMN05216283_110101 [Sunxiuqinia elliptica]|uniref:Uncharacterized protein n=1 Tax=Sunxiuqinia elliptica TaxID=655355 RepID=A0A1I2K1H4_9BACT|nr:hypothetical protein SAMN05216283_110101 [Sunxiuqinia elliptica]